MPMPVASLLIKRVGSSTGLESTKFRDKKKVEE
jgi:hypothetical protein